MVVRESAVLDRDVDALLAACARNGVTAENIGVLVRGKRKIKDFFVIRMTAPTAEQILRAQLGK